MARAMGYYLSPCGLILRDCPAGVVTTYVSRTPGEPRS